MFQVYILVLLLFRGVVCAGLLCVFGVWVLFQVERCVVGGIGIIAVVLWRGLLVVCCRSPARIIVKL